MVEEIHRFGGLREYCGPVSETPLTPHAATPAEVHAQHRAAASGTPLLVFRDGSGQQVIVQLGGDRDELLIGRKTASDLALTWDVRVSREHAWLKRLGADWTVVDDNYSRNGTWVNNERVVGSRLLHDGDTLRVGSTALAYCAPETPTNAPPTMTAEGVPIGDVLTASQRRVLVALCRPYKDSAFATPASNPTIAAELCVSVDAVKTTMRSLFDLFGIENLPQNQKRAALAMQALREGVVSRRDL